MSLLHHLISHYRATITQTKSLLRDISLVSSLGRHLGLRLVDQQHEPPSSITSSALIDYQQLHQKEEGWISQQLQLIPIGGEGLLLPNDHNDESTIAQPQSVLGGLWDGLLLMAVPKKKVSHRRQRRRLVRYECENIVHSYTCPACGKSKLRHRLCEQYELCAQQASAKYRRSSGTSSSASVEAEGQKEESRA